MTGGVPRLPEALEGGRYVLGEALGEGGMAVVVRAMDTELGVERAVKILLPDQSADTIRKRLRNEARAMAQLSHPNILGIHDVGSDGDLDWIVMDLAEGGSLQQRVSTRGPLTLGEAIGTMVQVLSALAAAHAAGIVHRDVKPHNILLDASDRPLLADFGIAMLAHADRSTRTGVAMGSLAFMPPEQRLDAAHVGPEADIYACGTTLFALLTNDNPVDLFLAGPDSTRWEGVPAPIRAVVQKACSPHPTDRHANAGELARDLLAVLDGLDPAERQRALAGRGFFPPPSRSFTSPGRLATPAPVSRGAAPTDATFAPPSRQAPTATAAPRRSPATLRVAAVALVLLLLGLATSWWRLGVAPDPAQPIAPSAPEPMPAPAPPEPEPEPEPVVAEPVVAEPVVPEPVAAEPVAAPPPRRPPPRPTPAPTGPSAAGGAWEGSVNGRVVRLNLAGSDLALTGELVTAWSGREDRKPVTGSYDPTRGMLELTDAVEGDDTGRYELRLEAGRLTGTFHRHAGGTLSLSLRRPRG